MYKLLFLVFIVVAALFAVTIFMMPVGVGAAELIGGAF